MKVLIKVSSWFKRYTDGNSQVEIDIIEGQTAYAAVCSIGIPKNEIGFISIEGTEKTGKDKWIDENYVVSEGEVLMVYPVIIGG